MAMTRAEDNDTPDQSPSERENVAGNEVGQRIGEIPVESVRCRSLGASHSRGVGCGFGACMGCTCETTHGSKRVCKDGPVFTKEEIVWPQQP